MKTICVFGLSRAMACSVVLALLVGAPAATASAQASDPQRTALARSLFAEGLAFGDAGQWTDAVDRYRRVLELRRSATVLFNLAHALSELGQLVEATELLQQVLRDDEAQEGIREQAEHMREGLLPRLGRLTIQITGDPETAEIALDGHAVEPAMLGVAAPMDPGHHSLTVHRDGEQLDARDVEIGEGEAIEVTLDIPAPEVPAPEEITPAVVVEAPAPDLTLLTDTGGSEEVYETWWFWTIIGAVVAGGVVAVVLVTTSDGAQPVECNFGGASCRMEFP